MPVTITSPTTGSPFGPGFVVDWNTDRIGPEPPGTRWVITLTAPADEVVMTYQDFPFILAVNTRVVLSQTSTESFVLPVPQDWIDGATGRLRVQLVAPDTGVLEQDTVDVVIDRQQGQAYELSEYIRTHTVAAGHGLTEDERNAVLQTNVGVIAMLGINPLDFVGDLAEAISGSPPLGFGSMSTTYSLSGDGEMPDVGDVLHTKLGIYFVATEIPAGLSHRHGQSEEYPARLIQWRTVHTVGGVELVTEVVDFETHGELWRWRQAKPTRIEYSILPGVTIGARWWQFP